MDEKKISCFDRMPPLSSKNPWFIAQFIDDQDNTSDEILFTIHKPLYQYQCRIPELEGRLICTFFHGWAILCKHSDNTFIYSLWNPITSKLISLPPLKGDFDDLCLSLPPDDPGSVLLLTGNTEPIITFCPIDIRRKKLKWSKMSYAKQLRSIIKERGLFLLRCLSCYNSKVYALVRNSSDVCVDSVIQVDITVVKEKIAINLSPFLNVPNHSYIMRPLINRRPSFSRRPSFHLLPCFTFIRYLKGSGTELFFIELGFEDVTRNTVCDVYSFKLDVANMTWKEMEDLKDDVFFIDLCDDGSIFYKSGVSSAVGGYIHILDIMRKIMYSYHVKDRTISLSYVPSLVETSIVSMLEFRFEDDHADSKQEEEDKSNEIVVRPVTEDEYAFNSTADESHLLNIPFGPLEMIMEFCAGEEYMKFRATCKRCHFAAPLIQSRLQTLSFVSPWLMMLDKHQGIITFTDPIFGDKYFIKTPQELINVAPIRCYRFGWLLMTKRGGDFVFFNPFTREIREVPNTFDLRLGNCWFSAPPTSPDCMLVGFDSFGWQVYIHFIAREPRGRSFDLNLCGDNRLYFVFPTYYKGDLYALSTEGELYIFRHLGDEDHFRGTVVVAETPKSRCGSKARYYQVKCDENLVLVVVDNYGESVEVFKLNDIKKEWEKIDDLGKHTIYIGETTCVCIEAKTRYMKNKIYFPRLHNGMIMFYSLETCTYNTSNEEYFSDFIGTTHHCKPHEWIEPSWS